MRKVFTKLDPVLASLFSIDVEALCANTSGFIGVIAAAAIIIAAKVIISFVVCRFIIYMPKMIRPDRILLLLKMQEMRIMCRFQQYR
jgi:hypothetical protein